MTEALAQKKTVDLDILTTSWNIDRSTSQDIWLHDRFREIQSNLKRKKLNRKNQGSNYLGGSFDRAPIQFRKERVPES